MGKAITDSIITIKLILKGRHKIRQEALSQLESALTSAKITSQSKRIFAIPDEIAVEFGWPEVTEMKRSFQVVNDAMAALPELTTPEGREREFDRARAALHSFDDANVVCSIWNRQILRWKRDLLDAFYP